MVATWPTTLYCTTPLAMALPKGRWIESFWGCRSHRRRQLGSHGGRGTGQGVEEQKGENGRQVEAAERWNDPTKQIQIRIGNGVHGLQGGDTGGLGKPRQENARRNDEIVEGEEIGKAANEDLFGDTVAGNGHGSRRGSQGLTSSQRQTQLPPVGRSSWYGSRPATARRCAPGVRHVHRSRSQMGHRCSQEEAQQRRERGFHFGYCTLAR
jgi:hypothetical protein